MIQIDIIVPYVDENDKEWQKDFEYYKNEEIKKGIQKEDNKQAFAEERTRDWDAFRFWFRGVEKNCPWVNKIFLVVQRESQLPKWLNRDHPKLRIVYHEEFIPHELLPTFSTLVIETFYYRIPDLSEHFIVSNDDFYFINDIPSDLFFKNDKIHQGETKTRVRNWTCGNKVWETIVNNNNVFLEKYVLKKHIDKIYHYSHLPDSRVKSFETDFMNKYYNEVYKAMSVSKFRHPKNVIPSLLFIDTMKYTGYGILDKRIYEKSKYLSINSKTDYTSIVNLEMVCFNDTAEVDDFNMCKTRLLNFLRFKFDCRSSFELYDEDITRIEESHELKKVFGIISWLPDDNSRKARIDRMNKTFQQIVDLWPDAEFLIIAQNWKDYQVPEFVKNVKICKQPKLGILLARKTLRKEFLKTDYDYLIMCDDDIILETDKDFSAEYFMQELDKHPNGFMFLQYGWSLNMCAISRYIYSRENMPDIDPQNNEGYEDVIFPYLLHYKYPKNEFQVYGIKFLQNKTEYRKNHKSTWENSYINHNTLHRLTDYYVNRFKKGNFEINPNIKEEAKIQVNREAWYERALEMGWINKEDIGKTC